MLPDDLDYVRHYPSFRAVFSFSHEQEVKAATLRLAELRERQHSKVARGGGGAHAKPAAVAKAGSEQAAPGSNPLDVIRLPTARDEPALSAQLKLWSVWRHVMRDYSTLFERDVGGGGATTLALASGGSQQAQGHVYGGSAALTGLTPHFRVTATKRPEVYEIVKDGIAQLNERRPWQREGEGEGGGGGGGAGAGGGGIPPWTELPSGLGLSTSWNLLWTWSKPRVNFGSLLCWQRVNHFPSSRQLTRKDTLKRNLERFTRMGGRLAEAFNIMPATFVLPGEYLAFVNAFNATAVRHAQAKAAATARHEASEQQLKRLAEQQQQQQQPPPPHGAGEDEGGGEEGGGTQLAAAGGERAAAAAALERARCLANFWIIKPVGLSRGRGIHLVRDISEVKYGEQVIIQQYVDDPLLLNGYKFDLRIYVLVTSFNPLEAFVYEEGFARVSTSRYSTAPEDVGNLYVHLTNSSIQVHNPDKERGGAAAMASGASGGAGQAHRQESAEEVAAGGTKMSLTTLWEVLGQARRDGGAHGIDVGALRQEIDSVLVKTLVAVEDGIPFQPNAFEVFGFDVLLDRHLKPWLIEVNASPSMARGSPLDCRVKEALIRETVALVAPLPFDRDALHAVLSRRLGELDDARRAAQRGGAGPGKQQPQEQQQQQQKEGGKKKGPAGAGAAAADAPSASTAAAREEHAALNADLRAILRGAVPRAYGEMPAQLGAYRRIAPDVPGAAAHLAATMKLKRSHFRSAQQQ